MNKKLKFEGFVHSAIGCDNGLGVMVTGDIYPSIFPRHCNACPYPPRRTEFACG